MKNSGESPQVAEKYPPKLREIITAAERGEDKDWEFVDKKLPKIAQDSAALQWAKKELYNKENNVWRYIAASILEKYKGKLASDDVKVLRNLIKYDKHEPVSFRAACALATHGAQDDDVQKTLQKATRSNDSMIRKHAREVLEQVEKKEK